MHYDAYDPVWGPVSRPEYRREPYVRVTFADGTTMDGKATAWTATTVLVHSQAGGKVHNGWFEAKHVQRIKRSQAAWQDVYDDIPWYRQQGLL